MMQFGGNWGMASGFLSNPLFFWPLIIWAAAWKGVALWKAARRGDKGWYLAIFLINLLGILEIIYIFAIAKGKKSETPSV